MRRWPTVISVTVLLARQALLAVPAGAAGCCADPAIQNQWNAGEATTPNF
jgi:hypothetical protein